MGKLDGKAALIIGRNVTGVQADWANLDELDRLFDVSGIADRQHANEQ